jgi:arginyl-tRNA synthetase
MKEIMGKGEKINPSNSYAIYQLEDSVNQLILGDSFKGKEGIISFGEVPEWFGADYGVQLTKLAGLSHLSPVELAQELASKITQNKVPLIQEVVSEGPFLNFKLDILRFGDNVVSEVLKRKDDYGKEQLGKGDKVVVDMSSPNIAKRMNYGHLRSTIIGDALANIYRYQGYEVIRDNHIGDWGTQFGKLITAIKKWGNEKELLSSADPIGVLQDLYVKFHSVAEDQSEKIREEMKAQVKDKGLSSLPALEKAVKDVSREITERKKISEDKLNMETIIEDALDRVVVPEIENEGREWFLKLENNDPEAKRLWKICIDLSMKEFNRIYETLGVKFELTLGESFYEDKLKEVASEVKKSKVGKVSDGALVVDMQDKELGVAIIQKSDGASVYMTRDLATASYREQELKANKVIYVVGEDQKQYFQQLFEILKRMGYKIGENSEHVYFGMVRLPEGKMSTRKGRTILLKDVIDEGFKKAEEIIDKKNPDLAKDVEKKAKIVRQIAIGALKWNDLGQDPRRSIEFHWEKALNFEGYGAPYVQYTAVRAASILEAAQKERIDLSFSEKLPPEAYSQLPERVLIRKLAEFPKVIVAAQRNSNPSQVAIYVFDLAKRFNAFYRELQVLKGNTPEIRDSRLRLVMATKQVIANSLGVLGIEVPDKM